MREKNILYEYHEEGCLFDISFQLKNIFKKT